jgi:hypothetical protein
MKSQVAEYILAVAAFLGVFFNDLQPTLWSLGFLIMTDTGLAIWATWTSCNYSGKSSRTILSS